MQNSSKCVVVFFFYTVLLYDILLNLCVYFGVVLESFRNGCNSVETLLSLSVRV